jgi:hypothetical protein
MKVIAAVASTLAIELADQILDRIGLSEDSARIPRELIKTIAATITAILVEAIITKSFDPEMGTIYRRH